MTDYFGEWVADTVADLSGRPTRVATVVERAPDPAQGFPSVMLAARPCGVYHLYLCGQLQYIGQSTDVFSRLASHRQTAPFEFDAFQVFTCEASSLLKNEAAAIRKHRPRWNKVYPASDGQPYEYRGAHDTRKPTKRKTNMQPTQEHSDPQDLPEDGYETDAAGTFKG